MNYLENALDSVDACVFTGDSLYDKESRTKIKEFSGRWLKAVIDHEISIPKCYECGEEVDDDCVTCKVCNRPVCESCQASYNQFSRIDFPCHEGCVNTEGVVEL